MARQEHDNRDEGRREGAGAAHVGAFAEARRRDESDGSIRRRRIHTPARVDAPGRWASVCGLRECPGTKVPVFAVMKAGRGGGRTRLATIFLLSPMGGFAHLNPLPSASRPSFFGVDHAKDYAYQNWGAVAGVVWQGQMRLPWLSCRRKQERGRGEALPAMWLLGDGG